MKGIDIMKKTLSYVALGGIIYLCFRYLPGQRYDPKEVVVMTTVSVAVYAVIDFLCSSITSSDEQKNNDNSEKLEQVLETFASTKSSDSGCRCTKQVEGYDNVSNDSKALVEKAENKTDSPVADDESYLKGSLDDEMSSIKEENEKLRKLVAEFRQEAETGPTELQKRMDPYNNKGFAYSTNMNQVTEEDENIPASARKIGKRSNGTRMTDGVLENDMVYSDYNTLPVSDGYKSQAYELGYSYIPPEKWYPVPPHPPVCVTERQSVVKPVYTTGVPVDVKEWASSTRITPPANINVDYILDKLNSGR